MTSTSSLLFFDTFSHETTSIEQLDLVQFHQPVQVSEIRVIPLGAKVQADFPGGVRLGATNPSQFEIEFFVNDLGKRGAATFENIGNLQYSQHGNIQLEFERSPPTDGVLLRGSYNTITLAVYGNTTKVHRETSPPPPPPKTPARSDVAQPPPEKVNKDERILDWLKDTKPRSPAEYPAKKQWEDHSEGNRSFDREKEAERDTRSRSMSRDNQKERSRERDKHPVKMSPLFDKSWDTEEKLLTNKDKRDIILRPVDYDNEPDYEQIKNSEERERNRSFEREKGRDKDRDRSREWDKLKTKDDDLLREFVEDDDTPAYEFARKQRSTEREWDERHSERSERSIRRPRTPPEPEMNPQDIPTDPRLAQSSPVIPADISGDNISSPKDFFQREKKSSDRRPRDFDTPKDMSLEDFPRGGGGGVTHLRPILSEEMEAISDDEDILDLPVEADPAAAASAAAGDFPLEEPLEDEGVIEDQQGEGTEDNDGFEYEEIMSDEEELPEYQYEDYLVEEWEDWIKPFSPQDLIELPELLHIRPPAQTEYERQLYYWTSSEPKEATAEKLAMGARLAALVNDTPLPTPPVSEEIKDADVSQDILEESGECWVQAVEQVGQLLPLALVYVEGRDGILDKLYSWVDIGLDFDMAANQQQPVFKIRHMKAGIRLSMCLMQTCSSIAAQLLNRGMLKKLFGLLEENYMALSIKLLIIRTIDAVTLSSMGLKFLISERQIQERSAYEHMLQLCSKPQQSRAKLAFAAVVRKIHLLEVCEKLYSDTTALLGFLSPFEEGSQSPTSLSTDAKKDIASETLSEKDRGCVDDDAYLDCWAASIPPSLVQSIVTCLKEILRLYKHAQQLLLQPNRWLPGSKQFQLPKSNHDPFPHLYTIFSMSNMLESLAVVLVTPNLHSNPNVLSLVKSMLLALVSSEHGLRYIAWKRKPATVIVKALLQFGEDIREDPCETNSFFQLGTQMVYKLHVLHQLDCIAQLGGTWKRSAKEEETTQESLQPDFSQAIVHFNGLESLLASPCGRQAVVSVLSMPKFTEIIFPYLVLDFSTDPESKSPKVTCFGYAADLLLMVVKFSDNAQFLESYADILTGFLEYEENDEPKVDEFNKFCEIIPYLSVAKSPESFTYENLEALSTVVQDSLEKLEKFPGELFTALRILNYLTIPKIQIEEDERGAHGNEIIEELKYKYATTQLFSCDLHTHLTNLLSKLCSIYQQPFLYASNFIGSEGGLVVSLITPTLSLLKNILNYIIQARNTEFKDLTAVAPLVSTYGLLHVFPNSSPYYSTVLELQQQIINILLGYTQAVYTTEGEDILVRSSWTQMMSEIFKQVMCSPHTIVGVITLVTELLPLPLPLQSQIPLTEDESSQAIRVRKLWSAHLYSLAPTLHEIIHKLGFATHPSITHSLRRMCVALSDLSAPMALLVARATFDLLLQSHRLDQRSVKEDSKTCLAGVCSAQTARVLNMLASLVSHAPTKAATQHLLSGRSAALSFTQNKTEEKYSILLGTWCKILTTINGSQSHCCAQEALLTIVQYLFDYENVMQSCQNEVVSEVNVQTALVGVPHKDLLVPITEALIEVLRISSSQILLKQTTKILLNLLDHSYGFYYVKSILDKKKDALQNSFLFISNNFKKDDLDSITFLQDMIELCQSLLYVDDNYPLRTLTVTPYELSLYLGWKAVVRSEFAAAAAPSIATSTVPLSSSDKKEADLRSSEERLDEVAEDSLPVVKIEQLEIKDEIKQERDQEERIMQQDKLHPLRALEQLVVSEGEDEEILEYLYEDISNLINLLDKQSTSIDTTSLDEPPACGMESLQSLFASRVVWLHPHPHPHDDLHSYWLSSPSFEEFEDTDIVKTNLLETCRKYAGNYDLLGTLHKLVKGQSSQSLSPQKLSKSAPKYKTSATAIRPDRRTRPYVAPMRGRNFGRGGGMNVRSDPFRSRPPNTSRPPSLHVDDFVALESTGHQPTGPTGYNKISYGRGKMMLDSMRGRGRPRGVDNRGRFLYRPPFRGDGGRGMNRGVGMRGRPGWIFRGDLRGNFRGPMNPGQMRFMRGRGPFMRGLGPPGPKDRFPPKFIDRGRRDGSRHMRGFR